MQQFQPMKEFLQELGEKKKSHKEEELLYDEKEVEGKSSHTQNIKVKGKER